MLSVFRRSLTNVARTPLALTSRVTVAPRNSFIYNQHYRSFSQDVGDSNPEMDDLEAFAEFTASGHPLSTTDYWQDLTGQVIEGLDEGDFPLDDGEIVFDQRLTSNPTCKIRVLRHSHMVTPVSDDVETLNPDELANQQRKDAILSKLRDIKPSSAPVSATEKVRFEFQSVYDGGDEHCDAPIVTTKAIIQTNPASTDALHPSSCALMSATALLNHRPRRVLLCSSWGGSAARYLNATVGCAVHIIDPDLISRDAARECVGFTPVEVADVPAHPLAVAALEGTPEEVVAAMDAAVQYGSTDFTANEPMITIGDRFTNADAYLRALFPHCDQKHVDAALRILADRAAAAAAREAHAKRVSARQALLDKQTALAASPDTAAEAAALLVPEPEPAFTWASAVADEPLAKYHSGLLELADEPVRAYDMIIQDTDASPALSTEAWLQLCRRVLAVSSKDHSSLHGVWVRRMTLAPIDCAGAGPFAKMDFESVNEVCARVQKVFKHVYVGQPDANSVVIMATDNRNYQDRSPHPITEERIIDVAVSMWEQKLMSLEVMEKVACFVHYTGQDLDAELLGPEAFEG